jgi:flavodoxin
MKKILVTYLSKTGITKKYAEEIKGYLQTKGAEVSNTSIEDFNSDMLNDTDILLFGAWTHGLMILLQHPDKPWKKFVDSLPDLPGKKTGLFTTYKLATGSMFKKMRKILNQKSIDPVIELKSKNGSLSEKDKTKLDEFIQ